MLLGHGDPVRGRGSRLMLGILVVSSALLLFLATPMN